MVNEIRQRGIALLIVLWGLVLLAVIAVSFASGTRTETMLARNLVDNAKARALADAGVHRAIFELLAPQTKGLLSPQIVKLLTLSSEPAAVRRRIERDLRSKLGQTSQAGTEEPFVDGWRTDGTVYVWPFAGGRVWVSIQDEDGKIDLNTAADELVRGLFLSVGLDEDASSALVDAIADFRDGGDLHRLNGAEDRDYADAGRPYGAKDAPFEAVEELQQVLGMTRQIYQRVALALTVHSGRRGIDPRVAPRAALLALRGVGSEEVESFLAAREGGNTENLLGAQGNGAVSRERMFTIRAEAESGAVFVREAVVELIGARHELFQSPPFRIRAWKQGKRAISSEPNDQ